MDEMNIVEAIKELTKAIRALNAADGAINAVGIVLNEKLERIDSSLQQIKEEIDDIYFPSEIDINSSYENPIKIVGTIGVER